MPRRLLGLAIREFLLRRGRASPYEFWREVAPDIQYQTVVRYFWILRQLGLVVVVGEEPSSRRGPIPRRLYAVAPGRADDPCWAAPQNCLALARGWTVVDPATGRVVPATALGSRRYRRLRGRGP